MPPEPDAGWERFRHYLLLLARLQMPAQLQGKLEPSDLVQQTLLEAHQRRTALVAQTDAEKAAYLRRVLANNLLDAARYFHAAARDVNREQALHELEHSSARLEAWLAAEQSSPSEQVIRQEEMLRLADALAQLPEEQRTAVEKKHLLGQTLAQIAQAMDRTETAVGGLLGRGIRKLRRLLGAGA